MFHFAATHAIAASKAKQRVTKRDADKQAIAAPPAGRTLLSRIFDAIIATRMRKAELELHYQHGLRGETREK